MNAEALVNRRLWVRAGVATSVSAAVVVCFISAARFSSATSRAAAVLVPQPFFAVLMSCVSPGASKADLSSPVLKRAMLYASAVQAAAATCSWMTFVMAGHPNPCGPISLLPGLCMRLTFNAVPILGMINARWYQNTGVTYWPSYRFALISTGIMQLARVAARMQAVRLAEAMTELGFPGLLPAAAACQAHPWFFAGSGLVGHSHLLWMRLLVVGARHDASGSNRVGRALWQLWVACCSRAPSQRRRFAAT